MLSHLERGSFLGDALSRITGEEPLLCFESQLRLNIGQLSSVVDLLPQTRDELYAFLRVLISLLLLLVAAKKCGSESRIEVNQVINVVNRASQSKIDSTELSQTIDTTNVEGAIDEIKCPCGSGEKFSECHGSQE
jgi:uncharacterized protein YecA (UPF0149 family)